jgi:hypothetical protein
VSAIWVDRVGVAVILLAASVFLARRIVHRLAIVFGPSPRTSDVCGTECGCGDGGGANGREVRP